MSVKLEYYQDGKLKESYTFPNRVLAEYTKHRLKNTTHKTGLLTIKNTDNKK